MCLYVDQIPTTERFSNCVPCFKRYTKRIRSSPILYYTPYQGYTIPRDGVLRVANPLPKNQRFNAQIDGGAIHAYIERQFVTNDICSYAYAFGVIAYGWNDLACSLLYVPPLDFSNLKKKRLEKIHKWQSKGYFPTNAEVKALFPNFVAPKYSR